MKSTLLISFVLLGLIGCSGAEKSESIQKRYETNLNNVDELEGNQHITTTRSFGSGLSSIAQGSANEAHTAVISQQAAGKQASYVAKSALAQAAAQAAATVQAALTGKEVFLHRLEGQNVEAHRFLEAQMHQHQLSKKLTTSETETAQQAVQYVAILTAALNSARHVAEQTEHVVQKVNDDLAGHSTLLSKARTHLHAIEEQYNAARIDYEATKEAAEKALASAKEAQGNAAAAAQHIIQIETDRNFQTKKLLL